MDPVSSIADGFATGIGEGGGGRAGEKSLAIEKGVSEITVVEDADSFLGWVDV